MITYREKVTYEVVDTETNSVLADYDNEADAAIVAKLFKENRRQVEQETQ